MANPYKGEVSFGAGGKTYTMVFTTNAICELEDDANVSFQELISRVDQMGIRGVRKIARAGLRTHHPELTEEAVGDIIDQAGVNVISEAVVSSFVKSAFSEAAQKKPGPRKASKPPTG